MSKPKITAQSQVVLDTCAKKLDEAGIEVSHTEYKGVFHEFFGMIGAIDEASDALAEAARRLNVVFGQ